MRNLVYILSENKMQNKTRGIVGNYSWSGGAVKEMQAWLEKQPFEFVEPVVEAKSAAKEEELNQLRALAQAMADNLASHADTDDVHYYSHIGESVLRCANACLLYTSGSYQIPLPSR